VRRRAADDAEIFEEALLVGGEVEVALRLQIVPGADNASGVAADELEDEALQVGRLRDVHRGTRRGEGLGGAARSVDARAEELVQHVVLVRGEHEATDRESHLLREETGQDVAEVPGGHCERQLCPASGIGRPQPGPEVVDGLRRDACEVDGVHRAQVLGALEVEVARELLHEMAVVEDAFDSDVVHVRVIEREHLRPLERSCGPAATA